MTQCCFDLKVRLLLSIKGQTFISARSAEGCGEEFIPSLCQWSWCRFSIAGSNCKSTCYRGLFSTAVLRPCHEMVDWPALFRFPSLICFSSEIPLLWSKWRSLSLVLTQRQVKRLCVLLPSHILMKCNRDLGPAGMRIASAPSHWLAPKKYVNRKGGSWDEELWNKTLSVDCNVVSHLDWHRFWVAACC